MRKSFMFAAALIAALALVFTACGEEDTAVASDKAELTEFGISGFYAEIPQVIPEAEWDDDEFRIAALKPDQTKQVWVNTQEQIDNVTLSIKMSAKATAEFGLATSNNRPDRFDPIGELTKVNNNQFIYVKITSENRKNANYYRFQARLRGSNAVVSTITIAGQSAANFTPGTDWNNAGTGSVQLTGAQLTNAKVVATPTASTTTTVKYAKTTTGTEAPVFAENDTFDLTDASFIYVEATAENTVTKNYYKIEIESGRVNTLKSVTITGTDADTGVTLVSIANGTTWAAVGTATNATVPGTAPFTVTTEKDDPLSTVTFGTYAAADAAMPTFVESGSVTIANGQFLAIRVVSENTNFTRYYKIRILIPSVVIKTQPVAGLYLVGDTAEPLTFEVEDEASLTGATFTWRRINDYHSYYTVVNSATSSLDNNQVDATVTGVATGDTVNTAEGTGINTREFTPNTTAVLNGGNARYYYCRIQKSGFADVFTRPVAVVVSAADGPRDVIVDLTKVTDSLRNTSVITGQYAGFLINLLEAAFPEDFDIMDYSRYTVSTRGWKPNGEEVAMNNWGRGGFTFRAPTSSTTIFERYNLGMGDVINASVNNTVGSHGPLSVRPVAINLTSMHDSGHRHFLGFIELTEIRFSGPARPATP